MFDEKKARRVTRFIECLKHTKGEFHGKPFKLLPWQEKIIRDVFGTVRDEDPSMRQYNQVYIEIGKKNGKSELGAALALNMLINDDEWKAEVYSCASDRQQAAIVFDVAVDMVKQNPTLSKLIKIIPSTKRMVYQPTGSIYQVLSSEVATKHGLNVSACIFDELHTQPTRALYDVMTQGSGDARKQPLWFFLTTAGTDRNSVCWEVHQKALDILDGRKHDPRFYPVVYGLPDDADWQDEQNWYKCNPSLGYTITIDKVRDAYHKALETPADENMFRQLRLNQWVKRSGLDGSRSSLFFEAVRVITEMRRNTNGQYPRWAVWENVPGALSSQHGQDFRCVLESLVRIKAPAADVPLPENGRWLHAGEILGDGYSLAWRVLDAAQGWGVAQRRKRIFAVLDLDGPCAGKVLFESEGLSGYTPPGREARKGAAPGAESGAGAAGERVSAGGFCTEHSADSRGIGYEDERAPTLRAGVVPGVAIDFNPTDSRIRLKEDDLCQTLCSRMGTGGNQVPLVFGISSDQSHAMLSENPHAGIYEADTSRTLDCSGGSPACNQGGMLVVAPSEKPCYCIQGSMIGRKEQNGPQGDGINREVAFTLDTVDRHAVYAMTTGSFTQLDKEKSPPLMARDYKDPPVVGKDEPVYALDRACFSAGQNAQYSMNVGEEKAPTLVAEGPGAIAAPAEYLVRRLTPGECCRLQGYPDGWCENLESPAPSNQETDRWEAIFEEWRTAMGGKTKPKTRRQIIRWLQNPHTDSAEYKAYGNSIVAQCGFFVLAGIVWAMEEGEQNEND